MVPAGGQPGRLRLHVHPGNRLWRKNLRDNNGDGQIGSGDGVDLNRNFSYKWGYDNEGSSPEPNSETYRGPSPNSKPETKALDRLFKRVGFEFFVNYHSAAELLLYGIGWQVSTPSPDDEIYKAMVGDDAHPAVPGYDPDISAELYTTNGDTDSHATVRYGTLGFTPEMSTCEAASAVDPDDEWRPEDCVSGFIFPDDEELIAGEVGKNLPFALAVAKSAADPDEPVSVVGRSTPDFVVDAFDTSYGRTQQVASITRRALKNVRMHYTVNGGRPTTVAVREWRGGERYGDTHDDYYAELRGTVSGAKPGDRVEVWFTGNKPRAGVVASEHFTYRVHNDVGGDVLVLAMEDVTGLSPAQTGATAKYADEVAASLSAAGRSSDVYDFDAMGRKAPHPLSVLSHYEAVVWETGDDVILRSPGQVAGTTAGAALETELAVRDYLNEGGKLLVSGQYALFAQGANGSYVYHPDAPPECTDAVAASCLPLLNDFQQYWLGAHTYVSDGGAGPEGKPFPVAGTDAPFTGFDGQLNASGSAENQAHTGSLLTTSSFLPPDEFPQFASSALVGWARPGGARRSIRGRVSGTCTAGRPTSRTSGSRARWTSPGRAAQSCASSPPTRSSRTGTSCSSRRTRCVATIGRPCRTPTTRPARSPGTAAPRVGWSSCTRSSRTTRARTAPPARAPAAGTRRPGRREAGRSSWSTCRATPVSRSRCRSRTPRTGAPRVSASSWTTPGCWLTGRQWRRPRSSRPTWVAGRWPARRPAPLATPTTGRVASRRSRSARWWPPGTPCTWASGWSVCLRRPAMTWSPAR